MSNHHSAAGAPGEPLDHYEGEKRCCTVCDRKKICHVCGDQTLLACSDCRIDFGVSVYVCSKPACRDAHERKCLTALRAAGVARPQQTVVKLTDEHPVSAQCILNGCQNLAAGDARRPQLRNQEKEMTNDPRVAPPVDCVAPQGSTADKSPGAVTAAERTEPWTLEDRVKQWREQSERSTREANAARKNDNPAEGLYLDGRAFAFERCADELELALKPLAAGAPADGAKK